MADLSELKSIIAWWRDAGVDCYPADTPVSWLKPARGMARARDDEPPGSSLPMPESNAAPRQLAALRDAPYVGAAAASAPSAVQTPMPADADALADWIADAARSPALAPPGVARMRPELRPDARLIVITDAPSSPDLAAGSLLSGQEGRLFDAMLRSIGLSRDETSVIALCPAVTTGIRQNADMVAQQIGAVIAAARSTNAGIALLLGDAVSRAMLGAGVIELRQNLHHINQSDGNLAAVVTLHPRFLLQTPAAKAQAWRDLLLLRRMMAS